MTTSDEFKKWYASKRDWYVTIEAGWECWQASRALALEEAAKTLDLLWEGYTPRDCAETIRALIKSEGENNG